MPFISDIEAVRTKTLDYIIVGGGAAGCVLAARLSENSACSVLLIESGGHHRNPLIRVPTGVGIIWKRRLFDWQLNSTETPSLNHRRIELMRGKLLGGSSAINAMSHVRGAPADYDHWQDIGCNGWSYDKVASYFQKSESWAGQQNDHRGTSGPVAVSPAQSDDPLYEGWMAAAQSCGHNIIDDYNALPPGAALEGFARSQQTIDGGFRATAWTAYLNPHLRRHNLHILANTHTTRIKFTKGKATALELVCNRTNKASTIEVTGTLILSAGAFHSPHLLMQSGIGPEAVLKRANIPVLENARGVGRDYCDHLAVQINFQRRGKGPFHHHMRIDRVMRNFLRAALFGSGPAACLPGAMHGFASLKPNGKMPDLQFLFRGAPRHAAPWWPIISDGYQDGFGIRPVLLHPTSRGKVEPVSNNPMAPPRITGNYLSTAEDMNRLLAGIDMALALADSPEILEFRNNQNSPLPKERKARMAWIRQTAVTAHHPCGTCRMGTDDDAPLTPDLRLRGFDNILVVDASIFPHTISGNINACVYMVAEKTASLLSNQHISATKAA
jgi:4-pyridoxate dehydrogenase